MTAQLVEFLLGGAALFAAFGAVAWVADREPSDYDQWADGTWDDDRN
jgi:hypothetical protein